MKISKKQFKNIVESYILKEYHPDFGDYIPEKTGEVRDNFKSIDDILYAIQPFVLGFDKMWNDKNLPLPVRGFAKFWMDDNSVVTEEDLTSEQLQAIFNVVESLSEWLFSGDESGKIKKGITYSLYDKFNKGAPVAKMFKKDDDSKEYDLDQDIIHFLGQFHVRNYKDYYLIEDYYDFNNVYYDAENPHWKRNSLPKFLVGFAAAASTAGKFTIGTLVHGTSPEKVLYAALRDAGDLGMQSGLRGYPIKIKIKKSLFK